MQCQDRLGMRIRLEVKMLTRKSCRHPGDTRGKVRRWFHIHHLPRLDHHRRSRYPGGSGRRRAGRNPSIRSKRCLGRVDGADRRVPILLHHCSNLQRIAGLELCLQFHEQYHVRGALCVHPGNIPYKGPRNGQCYHCDCEQDLRHHGSHHSHLREPGDQCTCLCVGSAVHRRWVTHDLTAF